MKKIKFILTAIATTGSITLPLAVLAADPFETAQGTLNNVGAAAEIEQQAELPVLIGNIINIALGFIGIILIVLFVYAGFLWMTAAGNPESVKKAKGLIRDAIIGLIITVAAYAITQFVLGSIIESAVGP